MSANEEKTEVMLPGKRSAKQEVVRVGKAQVNVKLKIKYFGVELDKKDTMRRHVRVGQAWFGETHLGERDEPLYQGENYSAIICVLWDRSSDHGVRER